MLLTRFKSKIVSENHPLISAFNEGMIDGWAEGSILILGTVAILQLLTYAYDSIAERSHKKGEVEE